MSEHSKAHEPRHGLIDSVKGKAKEIFGAVSGNDSLTAEGRLEQAEARRRKGIFDLPFAVLRFQYRLARFPFELIEQRFVARMDSEAPGRLLYERSLATVDVTVGNLLGDSELEERGAALAERRDALRKAAELDASAMGKVRQAEQEFKSKRDEATQQREGARNATQQAFKDARNQAEERKRSTAQAARKRTAEVKHRVDKTTAARTNAVETAKRSAVDQVAELADAEKEKRRAASAENDGTS